MEQIFPYAFPIFFAGMWILVTTILSWASGWFALMRRYPNRDERAIKHFRWQSGSMGVGTNMNGILRLDVCPCGLRIGMFRLFAPLARDFFVPWEEIRVRRFTWLFLPFVELTFGDPTAGRLCVSGWLGNRLARAAGEDWPEAVAIAPPTVGAAFWSVFREWLVGMTALGLLLAMTFDWNMFEGKVPMSLLYGFVFVAFSVVAVLRFLARAGGAVSDASGR